MTTTAPTSQPPPRPPRRRHRGGVVWPLLLIFIGAVFLLQNLGYLPATFWLNLWRLWPLVLVLAGIELLLAHRVPWVVLAAIAFVVLLAGGVLANRDVPAGPLSMAAPRTVQTELGSASQAAVTIHYGAGQLEIGALAPPASAGTRNLLATMAYEGPPDFMPQPNYTLINGGIGRLDYEIGGQGPARLPFVGGGRSPRITLDFNPTVPITTFAVQTGATDARIDLSTLQISTVDLSIGAASTWVRVPHINGTSTVHVSGGASSITVEVPPGVAASIRHRGGLNTMNVDTGRFPQAPDGVYRSADYDSATSRVDMTIETGITSIQVS